MPLLLRAGGDGWSVEVFGDLPELPPFVHPAPDATLRWSESVSLVEVYSPTAGRLISVVQGQQFAPIFFEAVSYDIYFESNDEGGEIILPPGAQERRQRIGFRHYSLDFGSNVGWWDIAIKSKTNVATVSAEVFSRKVDYRADYREMREEISGVLRNLAMTANAKTYSQASPDPHTLPTLNEWFALIATHFSELERLAGIISRHPHSAIKRTVVSVDVQRARKVSRSALEAGLRHPKAGIFLPGKGIPVANKVDQQITALTYDTPENRYFKGILAATRKKVRALLSINKTGDEDADQTSEAKFFERIQPDLRKMEKRLDAYLATPFLKSIGSPTLTRPSSMVLHRHPAYSRFDKLARLLCSGLSFAGGRISIGVKDTAILYEYWCFIKIVQTMRKRLDLISQSIVRVNRFKTTITLAKGRSAALQFRHVPSGRVFYIVYNRLFNRLPTLAQKPDNVIQLASEARMYVLDAKYRIQFDRQYMAQNGGPGPTTEDINTMHRYRDAIVLPHPLRPGEYQAGVVIGAAVLFPLPDENAYRQHRFHRSLDAVEIGGIPLLPGATGLFEEKLEKILAAECAEA